MLNSEKKKCHGIIHSASASAGAAGAGLAQIPGSDSLIIVPIQVTMIISLGLVFGKVVSKETATSLLKTFTATFVGRKVSQVLIGWIPGIGNAINASTAAGVTEALGWYVANKFSD